MGKLVWVVISFFIAVMPLCAGEELSYDANGNLISGDGYFREYNSLNQLVKIYSGSDSSGNILEQYEYDPIEERVIRKWVYEDGELKETIYYPSREWVRVENSSGTYDYHYVYEGGVLVAQINPDGSKYFYHNDNLGSATLITDESGDVIEETFYLPYGAIESGGENSRFDYEGKEQSNNVNELDFHARKYNTDLQIFTQPDKKIPNVYDPQQLNRYSFKRNNPFSYVDPDGREPVKSQAGNVQSVVSFIESVEAQNPEATPLEILDIVQEAFTDYENNEISNQGSPEFAANFVYTSEAGVIDSRHFFKNAYEGGSGLRRAGLSVFQYAYEIASAFGDRHSFFTYEDLVSNALGREFRKGLNRDDPLSQQYMGFMSRLGETDFPEQLWNTMPQNENYGHFPSFSKMKFSSGYKALPRGMTIHLKSGQSSGSFKCFTGSCSVRGGGINDKSKK